MRLIFTLFFILTWPYTEQHCCQEPLWVTMLAAIRPVYSRATVANNTQLHNYLSQLCCRQQLPAKKLVRVWPALVYPVLGYQLTCQICTVSILFSWRAYHGHSKPLTGLSTYKARMEKIPGTFRPNRNAIIVSYTILANFIAIIFNFLLQHSTNNDWLIDYLFHLLSLIRICISN